MSLMTPMPAHLDLAMTVTPNRRGERRYGSIMNLLLSRWLACTRWRPVTNAIKPDNSIKRTKLAPTAMNRMTIMKGYLAGIVPGAITPEAGSCGNSITILRPHLCSMAHIRTFFARPVTHLVQDWRKISLENVSLAIEVMMRTEGLSEATVETVTRPLISAMT